MTSSSDKRYLIEMQLARGMGIILVTLGHSEPIRDAYPLLFSLIYSFHMPLFFFMAGFFAGPGQGPAAHPRPWRKTVRRLAELGVPYVVISCCFAAIKLAAPQLVKRPVVPQELALNILLYPTENPALFLWFLYVIIIMKALTPLVLRVPALIMAAVLLVFQAYPSDISLAGLGLVLNYGIYYYAGLLLSGRRDRLMAVLRQRWLALALGPAFAGLFALGRAFEAPGLKFLTAAAGLTLVLSLCSTCRRVLPGPLLERFGASSLQLYLLQYFFIFPCCFLLARAGISPQAIVPFTFAAGLAGPWLLIAWVFPRSAFMALLLGGQALPARQGSPRHRH